jgi:hypothetical protein
VSRSGLLRALASIVAGPGPATATVAAALELPSAPSPAEHTELFDLQLYPYASVHLGDEGKLGGEARDRIAGFLRALDVVPPPEPDHLAVLLDAHASLVDLDVDGSPRAGHARRVLLHEHLASWVGRHLERVLELGPPSLAGWAGVAVRVLADESARVGHAEVPAPALVEAARLPDPREGDAKGFVEALLAPARSGLVIARADLSRAAEELAVGARIGERAYALRAMLAQDGPAVLDWLATEARRQAAALTATAAIGGPVVSAWWDERLTSSATLLAALASDGGGALDASGALDEAPDDAGDGDPREDERMVIG